MGDSQTEAIIGAAIEVHKALGPGLSEDIYEGAMAIEFEMRGIPFGRQVAVPVHYKGRLVKEQYMDLLVFGAIVVELKARTKLPSEYAAQVLSYMKAGGFKRGLLINFNAERLVEGVQRFVL
jgi:GxxExxY protein